MTETTRYRDPDWLRAEFGRILDFYYPACVDDVHGGFVAQLDEETGAVYDPDAKHLVATSRFTVNFALGHTHGGPGWCRDLAERGVAFLAEHHRDTDAGGYDWLLDGTEPVDRRRVCYGHAFVLLAYARAAEAGVEGAPDRIAETYDLLVDRFWEPAHDLCTSRYGPEWRAAEDYRGQNANMHACEALLAAHEATDEAAYLDRARRIARALCVDLAAETDGLIWEHYTVDWDHDFAYNRDEPRHQFRPWGYQPGHHVEWAKLLAVLDRHAAVDWALERAEALFDAAVGDGWDGTHGGFYYTLDREGEPIVADKYGWPVAEGIGAAAALYERTGDERYREWYDRLWAYAERALVAPGRNWYQKCSRVNEPYDTEPGPAVEPGYHPIGACVEGIRSLAGT
jgi:mannose/cellobiose epimerase-like protein (N-acyl-D-glucosamine 2-epimerase family)